jgi:uncharacterized protein YbaA (DUF1428 family)
MEGGESMKFYGRYAYASMEIAYDGKRLIVGGFQAMVDI